VALSFAFPPVRATATGSVAQPQTLRRASVLDGHFQLCSAIFAHGAGDARPPLIVIFDPKEKSALSLRRRALAVATGAGQEQIPPVGRNDKL
jgi:hypothetical protein